MAHSPSPYCPAPRGQLHCPSSLEFPSLSPDPNPHKCQAYLVYKAGSQATSSMKLSPTHPKWEVSFLPGLRQTAAFLLVLEQLLGPAGTWGRSVIGRVKGMGLWTHPHQQHSVCLHFCRHICVRFHLNKGSPDKTNLDLSESDGR